MLVLGDVAGDPKQLHGSAVRLALNGAFDRDPAFSTSTLLISEGCETVFCPTVVTTTPKSHKGRVQIWQVVRMDLRPHLRQGLRWCAWAMPVNAAIPHIIFEAAAFEVKAPGAKLGTIEGQLEPVVAVLKCCQMASPFGEHRSQQHNQGRLRQYKSLSG